MNEHGFACTPVPTSRTADHCCGISILYEDAALQPTIKLLAEKAGVPIDAFYESVNTDDPDRMKFC